MDIDDTLIRGAWKRRRNVWSTQEPGSESPGKEVLEVNGQPAQKKRRLKEKQQFLEPDYFPSSCEHMFGALPIPTKKDSDMFPHNVTFHTADWVNSEIAEDAEGYDVVVAYVSRVALCLRWNKLIECIEQVLGIKMGAPQRRRRRADALLPPSVYSTETRWYFRV